LDERLNWEIPDWGLGEPETIPRTVDRSSNRNDRSRLRALGNAVVPAQAYPIFVAIAEVERNRP
jgi:hypothetical protein